MGGQMTDDSPSSIRFGRSRHVALHYEVLSYVNLGRDAASLFIDRPHKPSWAELLRATYQKELPDALAVQFLPLRCADLDSLKARLASSTLHCFKNTLKGINELLSEHSRRWESNSKKDAARTTLICSEIAEPLAQLRATLWSRIEKSPQPLTIYHAEAMGRCGRAVGYNKQRAVAVSFNMPTSYVLCQIFHEETHVISDKLVAKKTTRSTKYGSKGYEVHRKLEEKAVLLGFEIIKSRMPSLVDSYLAWAGTWGLVIE